MEAELGQRLVVHLHNALPEATTLHFHGLRLPAEMDGNPMVSGVIEPGASFTYDIELRDPGLHWYHPHVRSDEQIERGLQGVLRVGDDTDPNAEGIARERVLVLDDVELDAEGTLVLEPTHEDILFGRRGNVLLVNGVIPGRAEARGGTVERWRLVNTSNGRNFALALEGHRFQVIGWDGGPVAQPYSVDELVIAPGERFDILVALVGEEGDTLTLRTLRYDSTPTQTDEDLELLSLVLTEPSRDPPDQLPYEVHDLPSLRVGGDTVVRRFELRHETGNAPGATFFINDQRWPLAPPLVVQQDAMEVWELVNEGDHPHPFHLHGVYFQVLDRDGIAESTLGWKDTVPVSPRGTTRLAVRYEAEGMWMFHCSIPEHAERGMMGDLLVEPR